MQELLWGRGSADRNAAPILKTSKKLDKVFNLVVVIAELVSNSCVIFSGTSTDGLFLLFLSFSGASLIRSLHELQQYRISFTKKIFAELRSLGRNKHNNHRFGKKHIQCPFQSEKMFSVNMHGAPKKLCIIIIRILFEEYKFLADMSPSEK